MLALLCLQLQVCLLVSVVSIVVSLVGVSIYAVDMDRNPEDSCDTNEGSHCSQKYYAMVGASFISCQYYEDKAPSTPTLLDGKLS